MIAFILKWAAGVMILLMMPQYLPGFSINTLETAAIAAVLIGLLNATIRPILKWLTMPLTVLTLGLFYFVINGAMFWFASQLLPGLLLANFKTAVIAAFAYSISLWIVNAIIDLLFKNKT